LCGERMVTNYASVIARGDLPINKNLKEFSQQLTDNPKVHAALEPLSRRERLFVIARATGSSMEDSATVAGYTGPNRRSNAWRMQKREEIANAIDVVSWECAYVSGIPAALKRQELWDLFQLNKTASPAAAVSAMKLLATLDGDIVNDHAASGGITINITGLGIPQQVVIEGDRVVSDQ